jgi:GAF domain-containing protein/HAMP domain-containing protein
MLQKSPLRIRLLLVFLLLVLIPVIVTSLVGSIQNASTVQQQTFQRLQGAASLKTAWIHAWQESLKTNLAQVLAAYGSPEEVEILEALLKDAPPGLRERVRDDFKENIEKTGLYAEIFLINPQGDVILSTLLEREGTQASGQPYFADLISNGTWTADGSSTATPIFFDANTGETGLMAIVPVTGQAGELIALLAGRADLGRLEKIMLEPASLGETGETYLIISPSGSAAPAGSAASPEESPVLLTPSRFAGYPSGRTVWPSEGIRTGLQERAGGVGKYRGYRGETVLGVFRWLPELGAVLLAEQEETELIGDRYTHLTLTYGIAVIAFLFTGLAAWIVTRRMLRPLENLAKVAGQISGGQISAGQVHASLEIQPGPGQEGEVGEVVQAFNSLADRLSGLTSTLEQRVAARTIELERRSLQLQVAAEVARETTAMHDMEGLLKRAVDLIRERFGFYHAGIFLVDEKGEWAVLRSATGEAGQTMLERGHRLRVGEEGIVGFVTGTGQPRIALDVGADAMHFKNPLLPDTRSEMALPLKAAGKVIGALDVQSTAEAAFSEDDVQVLQTMAGQVAVAIDNARLFQGMRQTLSQLETAQGRYTQDSWRTFSRRAGQWVGYQNRGLGLEPTQGLNPEARQALMENRSITLSGATASALAIPIRLRGQVFGVLNVRFGAQPGDQEKAYPVTPEMISMFEEIASRLSLVLENTRLLYEAQRLADREGQLNRISTQVRSSVNVDTILQRTVQELGKVLGPSRSFIQLGFQVTEPYPAQASTFGPASTNGPASENGQTGRDDQDGDAGRAGGASPTGAGQET